MHPRILACLAVWNISAACAVADTEITSDYIIDASNVPPLEEVIRVRGDAVLTIQSSPDGTEPKAIGKIVLYDDASLVVHSGELRGNIGVLGNNRLEFLGGNFYHNVTGTGSAQFLIDGMEWGSRVQFTGGVQHYEIRSIVNAGAFGNARITLGREDSMEIFSPDPWFRYGYASEDIYLVGTYPQSPTHGSFEIRPDFSDYPEPSHPNFVIHDTSGRPDGDADLDGDVDLQDLNIVRNAFGAPYLSRVAYVSTHEEGSEAVFGDTLPFDGRVNLEDLNRVRNNFGTTSSVSLSPPFRPFGDADGNGVVDAYDLIAVRHGFASAGPADGSLLGDTSPFDGRVDLTDLNNVRNHLVPEPSALCLFVVGTLLLGAVLYFHKGGSPGKARVTG